ncbi:hypothetical protein NQ315_004455 [Exocentrus adspersus]|uniref:Cytochrome P450 n=1 Tax=Exocentrus adspersus TaxID=1586481 RepID=A0AAV8VPJ3_9CUCU|nr:hypothetical protein NQ315_004455 [Exocentrus adspersus]
MDMVIRFYNQHPHSRYSGIYQLSVPTLVVRDPDLIKQMTVKDFDHFTDHRTFIPEESDPLWGKNLFALKGERWREMRAILSPSFTSSKMRFMFGLMQESAETFVKHFLDKNEDVVTVELKDIFSRFTNDVIATTAFGIQVDSLGQPNNNFYLMGKEATDFNGFWKSMKFLGYQIFPKLYSLMKMRLFSEEVSNFFKKIIGDTIKLRKENGIIRPDMIHLLMQARKGQQIHEETGIIDTGFSVPEESDPAKSSKGNKSHGDISDIDITAQAMIFFFASFESVSSLMCFLSYELAVNSDVQDKLRKEIRNTLKECGGKLNYESLLKMKYMDMVVSEGLRKWPSALALDRVCTKPYTIQPASEERPLHLEEGTAVLFPTMGIHRDPQYYPDPERFDPERFSDENIGNIKPYTYFPFGLGPRSCIGSRFALLETKIIIFYVLNNFEIVPVEKSAIPVKLSKKHITIFAEDGFWFGLKRISSA